MSSQLKLKFIDQQYQTDAVNAIVDIFDGCQIKDSPFTIDITGSKYYNKASTLVGEGISYELGYSNNMSLDDWELLTNVQKIQERNGILKSTSLENKNFTIEMETGTGKTYVYTKTILELNKKYGFTKFIIVVPSIAIKEGVYKSFQITEDHFKMKYDNMIYNYFVYDSSKLNRIKSFATSSHVEIMIINIDAFRKSFEDPTKENKANLIHRVSEKLDGNKPIDLIASTNPIVIIDEPQSVDNTKKAKEAIQSLNPLCILRYSATHKEVYNLMYRLTPVDAYQENLVKHIEVASVSSNEVSARPYVKLLDVNDKNGYMAKVEILCKDKTGSIGKKTVTVKMNDDLWELSKEVDYYDNQGYVIDDIDCFENEESITFLNGINIKKGDAVGEVNEEAIKRAQIRETIDLHLSKERNYLKHGIKVLSLFFIDEVANYRYYNDAGEHKGKYAVWFEEEYQKLINGKYRSVKEQYESLMSFDSETVHDGYFSIDGKGRIKNTRGDSNDDETTYEKIMKDKEGLLKISPENSLRFIFSHSALKEGWDNPNVFQVCTLVETKDTLTKRQKIGRGLRICVNQKGERVNDPKYNVLSVIANESYKDFASTLQRELEADAGYRFGIIEIISFSGLQTINQIGTEITLNQDDSLNIYNYLRNKEYIKKNGKVTEKFFIDVEKDQFSLLEEYSDFKDKIINQIKKLSRTIEIKDASNKIKVSLNKKVYLSDTFKDMWEKMKRKTIYSVNMDMELFKKEAINKISQMPKIEPERIERERTRLNITEGGVVQEGSVKYGIVGNIDEFENINYPDFIRRLQDSTGMLRRTIIEIISKSGRLQDFYINPETFIKNVSNILLSVKKANLKNGLVYFKDDNYFIQKDVFDDVELYGYRDKNVIDISNDKNIYDYVIFDSVIEKQFAMDAEADDDVLLYAKLPPRFKIDTPFGGYNPDWIVVLQSNEGDKLYFITETKGTEDALDRRENENAKIFCGRKHFEVLDSGIKYEVVKEFKKLKQI